MQNKENIEVLQQEHAKAVKSFESLEKYVGTLKLIIQKLQKSSEEITLYIASNNDHSNQEYISQMWHGLNNIEHQLKQFASYAEISFKDFIATSEKLVETLRVLRPPKDSQS